MYWNWRAGGLILGLVFFAAVALVKPIGVSTQFVIADGIVADAVNPDVVREDNTSESGFSSSNAYLDKSGGKYAKSVAHPLTYGMVFVLSMVLGGFLGRLLTRGPARQGTLVPAMHAARFGHTPGRRLAIAFIGGVLALLGARLAGGCTSGHMMSGMMQTSTSGYVFALAAFASAVPVASLTYRNGA